MATVVLDLDGTLYLAGSVLPGAVETIARLREDGHRVAFVTNTDSRVAASLTERLQAMGIDARPGELVTPVDAARVHLAAERSRRVLALTTAEVAAALSEVAELVPVEHATEASHVVVGDCRQVLNYPLLDGAFRAVEHGAQLLALQRGRTFRAADGYHLDTGGIVAALEYTTQRGALLLGKPSPALLRLVLGAQQVRPPQLDHLWVVGDDPATDVRMGVKLGAHTVLVRARELPPRRPEPDDAAPEHVLARLTDLPTLLQAEEVGVGP